MQEKNYEVRPRKLLCRTLGYRIKSSFTRIKQVAQWLNMQKSTEQQLSTQKALRVLREQGLLKQHEQDVTAAC